MWDDGTLPGGQMHVRIIRKSVGWVYYFLQMEILSRLNYPRRVLLVLIPWPDYTASTVIVATGANARLNLSKFGANWIYA